ncbi:MAG: hypothetical protein RJA07_2820 [Bacteroidota bacterium]|jgi:hypothetical protein
MMECKLAFDQIKCEMMECKLAFDQIKCEMMECKLAFDQIKCEMMECKFDCLISTFTTFLFIDYLLLFK